MRILIDIGHPAHVHIFKNFAWHMQEKGHRILFTLREKEHEMYLLSKYNFQFKSFGKNYKSKLGKLLGLILFDFKMLFVSLHFRPDIFLSHGSMYAAQVAWIFRKPHISLEDSGNMEQIKLFAPFSKCILTPDFLPNDLGEKQIRYKANHELFYLNPKYFTPSDDLYCHLGIEKTSKFAILRFVSWAATHDIGQSGFQLSEKIQLVKFLESHGLKVFISAERHKLTDKLKKYAIKIPPDMMHDALYFASIYIGEGATMASEAGVLGTPSFYVSSITRYYNVDQERFNLVYNYKNSTGVIKKIEEVLNMKNSELFFNESRKKFLEEKIDPSQFFIWFVENFPESFNIMKRNPDYQDNFK